MLSGQHRPLSKLIVGQVRALTCKHGLLLLRCTQALRGHTQCSDVLTLLLKQEERAHIGCRIRTVLLSAALRWNASLRGITESAHKFHHDGKEEHPTPVLHTARKNGPRLLRLVLNTEKSVCFTVSAWGVTLKFLGEKRQPPPSSWTLGMVSVKGEGLGPLLCHFPIRNLGVNY